MVKNGEDTKGELLEGKDFYIDSSGLLVMTESYLLRRGHCCKNHCRHCPYGFSIHNKKNQENKK